MRVLLQNLFRHYFLAYSVLEQSSPCFHSTTRQVNPDLPEGGNAAENAADGVLAGAPRSKRGSAEPRPGLMRTTFDEWDTLLVRKQIVRLIVMAGLRPVGKSKHKCPYEYIHALKGVFYALLPPAPPRWKS